MQLSDYIVVQMGFNGSAGEWEEYCRALVRLLERYGRNVRSVFLQRNVLEFEVADAKAPGVLVGGMEK
jgi:hypothetical protein